MQKNILIPPDQLAWVVILHLTSISTTRKSSNEHEFFIAVTSLGKIGEEKIRDLIGDVLFPMAFKAAIPTTISTVTMKNPGHCWCVMSNKALTGTSNRADPPRPWTGALTSRVLANRISSAGPNMLLWTKHAHGQEIWLPECSPIEQAGRSKHSPMNPTKTQETNVRLPTCKEQKPEG